MIEIDVPDPENRRYRRGHPRRRLGSAGAGSRPRHRTVPSRLRTEVPGLHARPLHAAREWDRTRRRDPLRRDFAPENVPMARAGSIGAINVPVSPRERSETSDTATTLTSLTAGHTRGLVVRLASRLSRTAPTTPRRGYHRRSHRDTKMARLSRFGTSSPCLRFAESLLAITATRQHRKLTGRRAASGFV